MTAAQAPAEAPRRLPRDTGLAGLYAGALRHLAGRAARSVGRRLYCFALCPCSTAPAAETEEPTAAERASRARHPSSWPVHSAPGLVLNVYPPGDPR